MPYPAHHVPGAPGSRATVFYPLQRTHLLLFFSGCRSCSLLAVRDEAGSCRLTLSSNVCGTCPVFHLPLILRVPCAAVPRFSRGPAGAPACILASPLQAPGVCFLCCTTLWYRRRVQTDLSCPIHRPFFRCRSEERLSRRSGDTRIYLTHHISSGRLYTAIISSFLSHHSFPPSLSYA